jgi:DHA1 family bicyclomycin/chloramphenicol resistance-like MFS transporter
VTVTSPVPQLQAIGSRRVGLRTIGALGALVALGPLTLDMYLPALARMGDDLGASETGLQLTLTGALLGLGGGQLVIGPLSDAWGRRRPLLAGLALHILASVGAALAPTITLLLAARVLQGIGCSAAAVIAMAIVRDLYSGADAALLLSQLMLVTGVAPVLAPTLGAQILELTSWRGVFGVLAVLGVGLAVIAATVVPETLPPAARRSAGVTSALRVYQRQLTDRRFVGLVLVTAFSAAILFSYIASSPFVFQEEFGLSPEQFGFAFGFGAVVLTVAPQLNQVLLRRFDQAVVLRCTLAATVLAAVSLLVVTALGIGLAATLGSLWVLVALVGLTTPNAAALALTTQRDAAGSAAALVGGSRFLLSAAAVPAVGLAMTFAASSVALAIVTTVLASLALLTLLVVVGPRRTPASAE